MKSLNEFKKELKEGVMMGLHQTQRDIAIRAAYADMAPADRKVLDAWCMKKYGRNFMDCAYDEQSAARSIISSDQEEVDKQNKRDALREEEEIDPSADEGEDKEKEEDVPTQEEKEEENEMKFVELLSDKNFMMSYKNTLKQYVSKEILTEEYNSFAIIPFVNFELDDNQYGVSLEFESAAVINVDKEGKVFEKEIPKISKVKYKMPEMEELKNLEDEVGITFVDTLTKEALEDIKKVAR